MRKQRPPELFDQGVEINILNDTVVGRGVAFFIEPFGLSRIEPIHSLIRGSFEAGLIDERFDQTEGVAKIGSPVLPERFDIEGEELGYEVRNFDTGQN